MTDADDTAPRVYTVGHSNQPLVAFLELLDRHHIAAVVDVRSSPYSKYATHFSMEPLKLALEKRNVEYHFFGGWLGGMPKDEVFYDPDGYVRYDMIAQTPQFKQGIEELIEIARETSVAIMCGEEDPTDCHRRLLIGRVLAERLVDVVHIRADGRLETEEDLKAEQPQGSLFDEEVEWKSTRSVSRRSEPPSSLD